MTESFLAALPMYDFPWTAAANDALWRAVALRLRERNVAAPLHLTRNLPLAETWSHEGLLFGQACGYPYVKRLRAHAALIATPSYDFPGCDGADHCGFIVALRDGGRKKALGAFAGARAACNAPDSNSGMNLFRAALAPLARGGRFFSEMIWTGSHRESLRAVAGKRADLACVDCVSFGQMQIGEPDLIARVEVVERTSLSPGLPFIASSRLPEDVRDAVRAALLEALSDTDLSPALRTLRLAGVKVLKRADYDRVAAFESEAIGLGYPELA
jgi:ABC-type phosphate/phosphonate transport system substrate-binding protein